MPRYVLQAPISPAFGGFEALQDLIAQRKKEEILQRAEQERMQKQQLELEQFQEQRRHALAGEERLGAIAESTEQMRQAQQAELERKTAEARAEAARQKALRDKYGVELTKLPGLSPVQRTTLGYAIESGDPLGGTLSQLFAKPEKTLDEIFAEAQARQEGIIAGGGGPRAPREGLSDYNLFNATEKLAAVWEKATQPAKKITQSEANVKVGLGALDRGDRPAASRTLVFAFNKLLDSISVVREGEVIATERAAALLDQVTGLKQKLLEGGSALPDSELRQMARVSTEIAKELKDALDLPTTRKRIEARAKAIGVDTYGIFGDDKYGLDEPVPSNWTLSEQPTTGGGGVPQPTPRTVTPTTPPKSKYLFGQ